jgi:hypothetical protein
MVLFLWNRLCAETTPCQSSGEDIVSPNGDYFGSRFTEPSNSGIIPASFFYRKEVERN